MNKIMADMLGRTPPKLRVPPPPPPPEEAPVNITDPALPLFDADSLPRMPHGLSRTARRELTRVAVEAARANLPLPMYLNLLHEMALSGKIPILSPTGQVVGYDTVDARQRVETIRYLIDKVMPDTKAVEVSTTLSTDHDAQASEAVLREMSTAELLRIATATPTAPTPEETTPPCPAPADTPTDSASD